MSSPMVFRNQKINVKDVRALETKRKWLLQKPVDLDPPLGSMMRKTKMGKLAIQFKGKRLTQRMRMMKRKERR